MSRAVARHCLQLGTGGKVITIRMCILFNVVQKNTIYFEPHTHLVGNVSMLKEKYQTLTI
jgi:hypothetical protein